MRVSAAVLLLAAVAVSPELRYFRYERPILNLPRQPGQSCLAIDPAIFAQAAPQLADLRLYRDGVEAPFVVRVAASTQTAQKSIAPLNLGSRGGQVVFDAIMPNGSYSDIQLTIAARDFIATVAVIGSQSEAGGAETRLGSYTIFDLTRQRLGRSTVLHLPASDFRYLHFRIGAPLQPENFSSLSAGSSPASPPRYQAIAESSRTEQKDHSTIVDFTVPAHMPVDRIVFAPGASPAQFSRDVEVAVAPLSPGRQFDEVPAPPANFSGEILRVHGLQDGRQIDEERLAIDAPYFDFDTPAKWTIAIRNGDDAPVGVQSVQLQMLERTLCFDAAASGNYLLAYGDPALEAPRYDYATLFAAQQNAAQAAAGPEQPNPAYQPRPDDRPFTERHPALMWIALAVVIALLGAVALRTGKATAPTPKRGA